MHIRPCAGGNERKINVHFLTLFYPSFTFYFPSLQGYLSIWERGAVYAAKIEIKERNILFPKRLNNKREEKEWKEVLESTEGGWRFWLDVCWPAAMNADLLFNTTQGSSNTPAIQSALFPWWPCLKSMWRLMHIRTAGLYLGTNLFAV